MSLPTPLADQCLGLMPLPMKRRQTVWGKAERHDLSPEHPTPVRIPAREGPS